MKTSTFCLTGAAALLSVLACAPPTAPAADSAPVTDQAATPSAPAVPADGSATAPADSMQAAAPTDGTAGAAAPSDVAAAPAGAGDEPPTGVRSLSGTRWVEAAAGGQFKELVFTDAFVFFRMQDDSSVTLPVDYTGSHPACLGYPSCIMTIDGNQQAVPFFLGMQEGVVFFVECTVEGALGADGSPVTVAGLKEELGSAVVFESPTTICWNPGRVPFQQAPR
jgi:hypothetical protein